MIIEFDPSTYIVNESDFLRDCETETICLKESGHLAWCTLNCKGWKHKSSQASWPGLESIQSMIQ